MDLDRTAFTQAGVIDVMRRAHALMESMAQEYPGLDYSICIALPENGDEKREGGAMLGYLPCANVPGAHMIATAVYEASKLRVAHHKIDPKLIREVEATGRKQAKVLHEGLAEQEKPGG